MQRLNFEPMKVLIIEDEPSLLEVLTDFLRREHYVVESASSYTTALEKVMEYDYDCVLLDIMLPGGSGLDLLRRFKVADKGHNVIIISAKDSVEDKIAGLDLGADDYLSKPFHLAELGARIRNVIRRKDLNGNSNILLGNVCMDTFSFEVTIAGTFLTLNRKEYDILRFFMLRPNHLIDKTRLAEAVWGDHIDQVDSFDFIYAQIKNLRKKMIAAHADIEIKAVYGLGYKLIVRE